MHTLPPQLRPMGMLDMLDGVFWTYRKHFFTFLGVVAVVILPFTLIETMLTGYIQYGTFTDLIGTPFRGGGQLPPADMILAYVALFGVGLIEYLVVQPIMYGAIVWAAAQRTHGTPISIRGAYGFGKRSMLALVGASFLVLLASVVLLGIPYGTLLGVTFYLAGTSSGSGEGAALAFGVVILALFIFLLALLGMLLLTVKLLFVPQAIVLETSGPLTAFSRSWSLTRGSFWRVLGILLLVVLVVAVLTFAIGMLNAFLMVAALFTAGTENPALAAVAQAFATLLNSLPTLILFPIYGIGSTLLYYDLRIRKEGADLQARLEDEDAAHA
jgi:hypothetical protein